MQQDLSQALSRQSQQEEEIEQLNTIARNALEDLNQKIDQFHGMQQQTMEQQSSIKQIQNTVNNAHQNQTELQLQVEKAVAAVRNHLEAVSKKEDNLLELERTITRQSDESAHIIADQQLQIDEQNEIIKKEFKVEKTENYKEGNEFGIEIFKDTKFVDIRSKTIGKGFAGVVKRYGFRGGDATHGNSLSHRAPGSIGQCQTPGRVFKGKRMAGHMGDKKRTLQNLSIVKVDSERNLLLVKGSVPGATGSDVIIRPAVKA